MPTPVIIIFFVKFLILERFLIKYNFTLTVVSIEQCIYEPEEAFKYNSKLYMRYILIIIIVIYITYNFNQLSGVFTVLYNIIYILIIRHYMTWLFILINVRFKKNDHIIYIYSFRITAEKFSKHIGFCYSITIPIVSEET
jgi:hypothetical protein